MLIYSQETKNCLAPLQKPLQLLQSHKALQTLHQAMLKMVHQLLQLRHQLLQKLLSQIQLRHQPLKSCHQLKALFHLLQLPQVQPLQKLLHNQKLLRVLDHLLIQLWLPGITQPPLHMQSKLQVLLQLPLLLQAPLHLKTPLHHLLLMLVHKLLIWFHLQAQLLQRWPTWHQVHRAPPHLMQKPLSQP
jgi:hypothetical protein